MKRMLSTMMLVIFVTGILAQQNWQHTEKGINTEKAYALLKGRKGKKVVVAVIDSGVDIEHEDLKGKIWVNDREIPDNGKDDDENGYIDDVNGWNFLGDVEVAQFELTRKLARLEKQFKGKSRSEVKDTVAFDMYLAMQKEYDAKMVDVNMMMNRLEMIVSKREEMRQAVIEQFGENYTDKDVKFLQKQTEDELEKRTYDLLLKNTLDAANFENAYQHVYTQKYVYYNKDFKKDAQLLRDGRSNFNNKFYGNNDVISKGAEHGTHCAGIIGANRDNKIGIKGVCDNAVIMPIRAVPNGDERDKDIAMAIEYAVAHGANVINMSFGKDYGENDLEVSKAIRYAEYKGVLIVHAAGNDGRSNDEHIKYPMAQYPMMKKPFSNFIEVGACTPYQDIVYAKKKRKPFFAIWKKREKVLKHKGLVAHFSNYGKEKVDLFAPGYQIYSTLPNNEYTSYNGTSMAAPVVSGVVAVLMSYFPELTSLEIKDIVLQSVRKQYNPTFIPGGDDIVPFSQLSRESGVVDLYNAVKLALEIEKDKQNQ